MKFVRLASLLAVVFLAGCYETEAPVFEKGEKIAVAGKFQCKSRVDGTVKASSFAEVRKGFWPFANYQYLDQDNATNLFRKSPSGLFVVQTKNKKGRFDYLFLDFTDENTFLLLVADVMAKGDYIEPLLKKHGVQSSSNRLTPGFLTLSGDRGRIADFLAAHDKSIMTVVAKCERAK